MRNAGEESVTIELATPAVCLYKQTNMPAWMWKCLGVGDSSPAARKNSATIALLYFIQGAPAAILWEVLPVYFRINGVSLRAIGGLRLLELPYSLKVFWSPLVHRYGDRRCVDPCLHARHRRRCCSRCRWLTSPPSA